MDKTTMSALLMRPLTTYEDANFITYLKIARENLDELLCTRLCDTDDPRIFDARSGYSTVWTDIFTDIPEVKINGEVVTNYTVRQNDRRTGSWYNSIVFDTRFRRDTEVEISAPWGFSGMPTALQSVLAGLFDLISKKTKLDGTVSSKQVEDFRITFNVDADIDEEFNKKYSAIISKYSLCNRGKLRHETGCHGRL